MKKTAVLRVVAYLSPDLRLGIHKVLESDSCIGGQARVSNHPQHKGVARLPHPWGRCEIELLTHAQSWIPTLVEVWRVRGQALHDHMVEERGGVVEIWICIAEIVHLHPCHIFYVTFGTHGMTPQHDIDGMIAKYALHQECKSARPNVQEDVRHAEVHPVHAYHVVPCM